MNVPEVFDAISDKLQETASGKSKYTWCKYLKDTINYIGVSIPDINRIVKDSFQSVKPEGSGLKELVLMFMRAPIAEYKYAGITIMKNYFHEFFTDNEILGFIEGFYGNEYVYDWSTNDWIAERILTQIIDRRDEEALKQILSWRDSENIWKARASLAGFPGAADISSHMEDIFSTSEILIKKDERFLKTAVGWVMRELTAYAPDRVKDFLRRNSIYLTGEVITNAIKYLDKKDQKEIKKELKKISGKL